MAMNRSELVAEVAEKSGNTQAAVNGVLHAGKSLAEAARSALEAMGARKGGLITLYYGGSQKERDAQRLATELHAAFASADVEYYYGGQKEVQYWVSLDE